MQNSMASPWSSKEQSSKKKINRRPWTSSELRLERPCDVKAYCVWICLSSWKWKMETTKFEQIWQISYFTNRVRYPGWLRYHKPSHRRIRRELHAMAPHLHVVYAFRFEIAKTALFKSLVPLWQFFRQLWDAGALVSWLSRITWWLFFLEKK